MSPSEIKQPRRKVLALVGVPLFFVCGLSECVRVLLRETISLWDWLAPINMWLLACMAYRESRKPPLDKPAP